MAVIHACDLAHSSVENAMLVTVVASKQDKSGCACRYLQSKGLLVIKMKPIILKQVMFEKWLT